MTRGPDRRAALQCTKIGEETENAIPGAEYLRQSPPAPRNVGTPDSAETPAPVRMTTRLAAARCARKAAMSEDGRRPQGEGVMARRPLEAEAAAEATTGETRRRTTIITWRRAGRDGPRRVVSRKYYWNEQLCLTGICRAFLKATKLPGSMQAAKL